MNVSSICLTCNCTDWPSVIQLCRHSITSVTFDVHPADNTTCCTFLGSPLIKQSLSLFLDSNECRVFQLSQALALVLLSYVVSVATYLLRGHDVSLGLTAFFYFVQEIQSSFWSSLHYARLYHFPFLIIWQDSHQVLDCLDGSAAVCGSRSSPSLAYSWMWALHRQ